MTVAAVKPKAAATEGRLGGVEVEMGGVEVEMMLDSGSSVSLIQKDVRYGGEVGWGGGRDGWGGGRDDVRFRFVGVVDPEGCALTSPRCGAN